MVFQSGKVTFTWKDKDNDDAADDEDDDEDGDDDNDYEDDNDEDDDDNGNEDDCDDVLPHQGQACQAHHWERRH